MIYSLRGKLCEKTPGEIVIECGGVGYLAAISSSTAGALPAVGEEAQVYTYLHISENEAALFAFADRASRSMFLMLTGVSGVGPRVGLAILSALPPDRIALAISAGDAKALTAANGVGNKLAQRLVLELKDKVAGLAASGDALPGVGPVAASGGGGTVQQALAALVSLGYSASEAALAVNEIDHTLPTAEIIRLALRGLGKR